MNLAMAATECLDENAVIALLEPGGGDDPRVQAHLDVCPDCRWVVAELARSLDVDGARSAMVSRDAASARVPLASGAVVGERYRLLHFLGEGGVASVWSATGLGDSAGGAFALKFLKWTDPAAAKRFLREGRVTAALRHPNIVHVHDAFDPPGFPPVIVMDLLHGETLRAHLTRKGALSLAETAAIVRPMLAALAAAHARGVVHRDLKPDNVFLEGAVVKVLDFGLAKLTALEGGCAATSPLTNSGHILGTPTHMAPEQLFGEKEIDARAEIWSLGVVLFECLSARRPIEGRSIGQALRAISSGKLLSLAELAPALPTALTHLVGRMLSIERSRRPSLIEVGELLARLDPG